MTNGRYTDLLGIKFKIHGRDKNGYDCYGLAMEVLKRNGICLPDVPYNCIDERELIRADIYTKVDYEAVEKPYENCILEIEEKGLPVHVAVYIGEGKIIHSTQNRGVVIEPFRLYERKIRGIYKVKNSSLQ